MQWLIPLQLELRRCRRSPSLLRGQTSRWTLVPRRRPRRESTVIHDPLISTVLSWRVLYRIAESIYRHQGNRGVVWEHELPNEIEYNQEKPFFHAWQGDVSPASADPQILSSCRNGLNLSS
jgi:hypothetical protein